MKHAAFVLAALLPLLRIAVDEDRPLAPAPRIDDLDRVIQKRFGNPTEEDIHQGRLGVSRLARSAPRRIFIPARDEERAPLARLREEGWSVALYILGSGDRLYGPIRTSQEAPSEGVEASEVTSLGKRSIVERSVFLGAKGAVRMEARPIPVSGNSCSACHDPNLKEGDPLGAVVYVLRRAGSS